MHGGLVNLRGCCNRPMSVLLVASVAVIVAWPAARSAIRALLLRRKLRRASSTEPPYPKRMMMDDRQLSRLCNLPDDILHSIMALLPLEEAVRTCILSTRWERLWRSMPCLNFQPLWNRYLEKPNHQFINFVNGVCTLRDEEFPIQGFRLTYKLSRDNSDAPVLSSWIMSAIKGGGVQNLSLSLYSPTPQQYVLPSCIFCSETLVKLDLRLRGSIMLRLPDANSWFLPRLKDLHLVAAIVGDGESLEQLISSPSLEKLGIVNCIWQNNNNIKSLKISGPKLRDLNIIATVEIMPALWLCCDSLDTLFCNVVLKNKIHISSPAMKKIDFASLHIVDGSRAENVFDLLSHLSGVKKLTLSRGTREVFNSSLELFEKLPQFNNLIKLTLSNFKSYGITTVALLRKTPCLETLYFLGRTDCSFFNMPPLDPVPLCFENHLKKVILRPFHGRDINVLGMMLKVGLVLEDVIVWEEVEVEVEGEEEEEEVSVDLDTLNNIPKGSRNCRITKRRTNIE